MLCIYIYISIYISLLCMYRCVSVTYKHKTFCKIYTGTPSPTTRIAEVPGMQHKHCSVPGPARDDQDPPGREARGGIGSCGAAGAPLEPGRDRSVQTAAAGEDVQQVLGLWRGASAAGFVPGAKPGARPGSRPHRRSSGLARERQAQRTATLPEASHCSAC